MEGETSGLLPINAVMGWNEGVASKNDAIELAKGFITRRFTAVEASWYAVAPFMGGYLWEVHEGGPGQGYIESVVESLAKNPASKFWFPSRDRVFQMMMRDGKPFGILLNKVDSIALQSSGQPSLVAVTKMKHAVKKGAAVLWAGAALMGSGTTFLLSAVVFYLIVSHPGPSLHMVDFSTLPHAQWPKVVNTDVEEIVSKLELKGTDWSVVKRPHIVEGLKDLRDEGQKIIDKAREGLPPVPVETPEADPATIGPPMVSPNSAPVTPAAPAAGPTVVPSIAPESVPPAKVGGMSPIDRIKLLKEARDRAKKAGSPKSVDGAQEGTPVPDAPQKIAPPPVGPTIVKPEGTSK